MFNVTDTQTLVRLSLKVMQKISLIFCKLNIQLVYYGCGSTNAMLLYNKTVCFNKRIPILSSVSWEMNTVSTIY